MSETVGCERRYDPRVHSPRGAYEEIEIRTVDGTVLRAIVDEPLEQQLAAHGGTPKATLVLAHAMFARKSSWKHLLPSLSQAGYRTVAFDFRGHGDSRAGNAVDWGYDDLVRIDLPAVVECVQARWDGIVAVVGHSLGAHVALAAQGTGRAKADAIVSLGGNVWLRELEPSSLRWAAKVGVARAMLAVAARTGRIPARRLRIGSDDASGRYIDDLFAGVTRGRWESASGEDYLAALSRVTIPVASVVGDRDRLMCHPASGERFVRRCGGNTSLMHAPVGHMALVSDAAARGVVLDAVAWAVTRARTAEEPPR